MGDVRPLGLDGAIRVAVVEEHEIVRYGLCLLLDNEPDIDIIGQAANAAQTLELLDQLKPDIVLLDLYMPGVTGT